MSNPDRFLIGTLTAVAAGDAVLLTVDAGELVIRIHLPPEDAETGGFDMLIAAAVARSHAARR